jgi:dinuclear metal center YbgI/SA1388 family protein
VSDVARLADVLAVLDELYDPHWAEEWDAVGLVVGDPDDEVRRVLFAVDPVMAVIEEAAAWEADLLVTHHPLLLRGVHSVATTSSKGRAVTALVRSGIALHVAHTNADVADPGVSDALAAALGLVDLRPLRPAAPAGELDKVVTFVPHADAEQVIDALAAAGAGELGDYARCAWTTQGVGTFLPLAGAQPAVGEVGTAELVAETRIEMVLRRDRRTAVVAALKAAHPYEEPAYDVLELAPGESGRGLGRIGLLPEPESLDAFAARVAGSLPATAVPIRVAGDRDRPVRSVAVCGGAGDDLFGDVRASGADVFVTADLRHHPASEVLEQGPPALVDCPHWATEWPWLADAERLLLDGLTRRGATVQTRVSTLVTDPWTSTASNASTTEDRSQR